MRQRPQYLVAAFAAAGHETWFVDPRESRERTVDGVKITTLDISGTFKDRPAPQAPRFTARKNYRMMTAIVQTEDGPYYFRMVGPKATIAEQAAAWTALVKSLKAG